MPNFVIDISGEVNDIRQLVGGKRTVMDRSMLEGFGSVNQVSGYVQVSGIPEVIRNWENVSKQLRDKAETQTRVAAALIAEQSAVEVPFDEGFLQKALRVEEEEDGQAFRVYVYYDGSAEGSDGKTVGEYMWLQHERWDYHHPTPGTKFKYLEDPFKEVSQHFPELCENALRPIVQNPGLPRLRKKGTT